jgi:uncharacterized protein
MKNNPPMVSANRFRTLGARRVAALTIAILIFSASYGTAQTTLQRCLGIVPGQEPTGVLKPSAATMQYCHQIPGWDLYDQAGQKFQAGDHPGAAQLLTKAAEAGNPVADLRLAMMYEKGDGVPRNLNRAFGYYKAAAEKGEPAAQTELAGYYEYGDGVVQDDWDESAKWLRASAEQGWLKGEQGLGRAYEYGIGVPLNLNEAIAWYDKAAAKGDGQAAYFAKYLRDNHGIDGSSRDADEQAMLGPLVKRFVLTPPPLGMVFHTKEQRLAYVRGQAYSEARQKQQMEYNMQKSAYDTCRNGGGADCHPPVTPPPR